MESYVLAQMLSGKKNTDWSVKMCVHSNKDHKPIWKKKKVEMTAAQSCLWILGPDSHG